MPHERLTDEDVATLAAESVDVLLNVGWREAAQIRSIAVEVQQGRARRCGDCWHFHARSNDAGALPGDCMEPGDKVMRPVREDWFCADFTPKTP